MALAAARETGYRQMIIECQNNNVPACRFYRKQGAVRGKVDRYAYYDDPMLRNETQLIWYLDLHDTRRPHGQHSLLHIPRHGRF